MKLTHDDFRTAARVMRFCLGEFESEPWWRRWSYPVSTLTNFAVAFDQMADDMDREDVE